MRWKLDGMIIRLHSICIETGMSSIENDKFGIEILYYNYACIKHHINDCAVVTIYYIHHLDQR